jgi:branched-chain amino acid aminotransferase
MAIHRQILYNGTVKAASDATLRAGQIGLLSGWGVFSTLRVKQGALFAWPRHWARMTRDAALMNVPMPASADQVELDLLRLVEANIGESGDCTLRVVVVRNGGGLWEGPGSGQASDTIALTADIKKWGASVKLGIQAHGRYAASDFTRAKILSWSENLRWAEKAQENGFDEVLLLNEHGRVAECTSANVFAVFGNEVVTPPLSDGCLPGITREVTLELQVPGVQMTERSLSVEDLYGASEVFITSSTRDLLAVSEVAGKPVGGAGVVSGKISEAFQKVLNEDTSRRRSPIFMAFR